MRDQEFIDWFENNIVDSASMAEFIKKYQEENPEEQENSDGETNSFIRTD